MKKNQHTSTTPSANKQNQPQHEMRNNSQNGGGGILRSIILVNNNVFVRCCGRGKKNVASVPRR